MINPRICVVGSFMMDLVIKAERRPQRGETIIGQAFGMFVGGKGFNQALAAKRLGAEVVMVGKLGQDDFGDSFLHALRAEGIQTDYIFRDGQTHTGVGSPVIDNSGDNSIIVVPGANMLLSPKEVEEAEFAITSSDLVVTQLEIPIESVTRVTEIASNHKIPVLLNPAPARDLPVELLRQVTIIVPNETETEILTKSKVQNDQEGETAAKKLLALGPKYVVITLGSRGSLIGYQKKIVRISEFKVNAIDTTAAGDAFCGALAYRLSSIPQEEWCNELEGATLFANAAGAIATTIFGASPSMPTIEKVEALIVSQDKPEIFKIGD